MRYWRNLLYGAIVALAAMALGGGSASAGPITVYEEVTEGQGSQCNVVVKNVHSLVGGCHVEIQGSDISLVAHSAMGEMLLSNCDVHLEVRINGTGEGWFSGATFTAPASGVGTCSRRPCDEANGTFIPWEIHIEEPMAAQETVDVIFCLRNASDPAGTMGSACRVVSPLISSNHMYQVMYTPAGGRCTNFAAVGIEGLLETVENEEEDVEIVH